MGRILKRIVNAILILSIFLGSIAYAQVPPPLPPGTVDPRWTGWSIGEVIVRALHAKGDDIWIGTSNGLLQFNRKEESHQLYNVRRTGLLSNVIVAIQSDTKGNVWIGTYGGGLAKFDQKKWEIYTPYGYGDKAYGANWVKYTPDKGLGDLWVYDLLFEPDGEMWVATWKGASVVKKGGFKTYTMADGLVDKWVYTIEREPSGVLWFGTEGGINRFDGLTWQGWTHKDGLGAAIREKNNRSGIGKNEEYEDDETHHLQQGRENQENNPNYVISSAIDKNGILWFGTWGGGLSRFDGKTFTNYTTKEGLAGNIVNAIEIDKKGILWIGTNEGVSRYDGNTFRNFNRSSGLLGDYVFSIAIDNDGHKWFGTFGGVSRYTGP